MNYYGIDFGDPLTNVLIFLGLGIVGLIIYSILNPPFSNIIGVSCVFAPLIFLQFMSDRPVSGILLIIIAGFILKNTWSER